MESTNEIKKLSFFRRIKIALIDLEDYILFLPENFNKVVYFMLKMSLLLATILVIASIINIFVKFGSFEKCVESTVPDFTYTSSGLKMETDSKLSDEEAVIINNLIQIVAYDSEEYTKADLVKQIKELPKISYFLGLLFYLMFDIADLMCYWFLIAFLIIMLEFLLLMFSRIKIKFSKMYMLSIYASTLSIILTVIYSILNECFGVYIDIFDYMTIIIAYIYISAVVLLIKSEVIKQQIALIRITNIQNKIKEEIEPEEKKSEDKKEEKKESEEKQKEDEKKSKENEQVEDEPDGSEI